MTQSEYIWAWSAYALGATVFFAVFWYSTRNIKWRELKHLLRIILAVILIVPWQTDADHDVLSPAWIISLGDAAVYGPNAFWRAGLALVLVLILAILFSSSFSLVQWYRHRKRTVTHDDA